MGRLRVLRAGTFDTVQDTGRPGFAAMGVPVSGAADAISLGAANWMVGNAPGAGAIEITHSGGRYLFDGDVVAALAGAAMPMTVARGEDDPSPRLVGAGRAFGVRAGEVLAVAGASRGARAYLAVAGGFRVPSVLGSVSALAGGPLGGVAGRALRAGDEVEFAGEPAAGRALPGDLAALIDGVIDASEVRVVPGPHAGAFGADARRAFCEARFVVSPRSSRAGLRLEGPRIAAPFGGRMCSEGMVTGAVQVTESGSPIVLMPDGPTTGGYPVIACVIAADRARLGQRRPGGFVRFREVTLPEAWAAARDLARAVDRAMPAPRG